MLLLIHAIVLLDLIESNDIPTGVEFSAWTLKQINKINPIVQRLKRLKLKM